MGWNMANDQDRYACLDWVLAAMLVQIAEIDKEKADPKDKKRSIMAAITTETGNS